MKVAFALYSRVSLVVLIGLGVLLAGCGGGSSGPRMVITPDRRPAFGSSTGIADQNHRAGTAIATLQLPVATGGDGALTYALSPAVPGLTFSATARRLTGTPTTAGTYNMTYSVADADGDRATLSFVIRVGARDSSPAFGSGTSIADQDHRVGTAIAALQLPAATGGDGALAYALSPNVPGLTFSATTRRLTGTPTTAGTYIMTYSAADADGDSATLSFVIRVGARDGSPVFGSGTSIADQDYRVGTAIAALQLPVATGGDGALTYALSPDVPGLTFSATTRRLTGTPTTAGTSNVTYSVADADGDSATLTFVIRVGARAGGPAFGSGTSIADQDHRLGTAIAALQLPAATGGDGALTYALSPNVPGLTFTATTRRLTGTPTTAGVYNMTYSVADADGDRATLTFIIRVGAQDSSPSFGSQSIGDQSHTLRMPISALLLPSATGGNGALVYTLVPAVPGLTFDPVARRLIGTPTTAGTSNMTYSVADADGDSDSLAFVIMVGAPDLIVASVQLPDRLLTNQKFDADVTVRNQGDRQAVWRAEIQYYFSTDATISSSDQNVGSSTASSIRLAAGETIRFRNIMLPRPGRLDAPSGAGSYYFGACVNTGSGGTESITDNNCSTGEQLTVFAYPQASIAVTSSSAVGTDGELVTDLRISRSPGMESLVYANVVYRYSSDSSISSSDARAGAASQAEIDGLNNGGLDGTLRSTVQAPSTVGDYYLGACIEFSWPGVITSTTICTNGVPIETFAFPQASIAVTSSSTVGPNEDMVTRLRIIRMAGMESLVYESLIYHYSVDSSISSSDTRAGAASQADIDTLNSGGLDSILISSVQAPSTVGVRYLGACVEFRWSGVISPATACTNGVRIDVE